MQEPTIYKTTDVHRSCTARWKEDNYDYYLATQRELCMKYYNESRGRILFRKKLYYIRKKHNLVCGCYGKCSFAKVLATEHATMMREYFEPKIELEIDSEWTRQQ